MKDYRYLDLAKDLLADIRESDDTLPEIVRGRMGRPKNRFLHYVFIRKLGEGAMATVWQAWHTELRRFVALKVLRPRLRPEAAVRFSREAQLAASLMHPNIVRVYHHGSHDEAHFIEMEWVDGLTLDEFFASDVGRSRPLKERVALLAPICRALAVAHAQGIVHRDVNLRNILVGRADLIPRLTDFGLAKTFDGEVGLTETGQILGTPAYMSPEQARGKGGTAGPASDIYSLGAVLYRIITGQPPYRGDTAVAIARQIDRGEPLRPSRVTAGVDPDLERIVLKAMQREPVHRYTSADAMAEDLERWQAGGVVRAQVHTRTRRYRFEALTGRRSTLVGVVVALMILGLVAGLYAYLELRAKFHEERASREKIVGEMEARTRAHEAEMRIEGASSFRYHGRNAAEHNRLLREAIRELEEVRPDSPAIGKARCLLAGAGVDPGLYREAMIDSAGTEAGTRLKWDFYVYCHIVEAAWGEPALKSVPASVDGPRTRADLLLLEGKDEQAFSAYRDLQEGLCGDPLVWLGAGLGAFRTKQYEEGIRCFDRCLGVLASLEESIEGAACALVLKGHCLTELGQPLRAARHYMEAARLVPENEYVRKVAGKKVAAKPPEEEEPPDEPEPPPDSPEPMEGYETVSFRLAQTDDSATVDSMIEIVRSRLADAGMEEVRLEYGRDTLHVRIRDAKAGDIQKAKWVLTRRGVLSARVPASRAKNDAWEFPETPKDHEWAVLNLNYPGPPGDPPRHRLLQTSEMDLGDARILVQYDPGDRRISWTLSEPERVSAGQPLALLLDGEIFWYGIYDPVEGGALWGEEGSPVELLPTIVRNGPLPARFEPVE